MVGVRGSSSWTVSSCGDVLYRESAALASLPLGMLRVMVKSMVDSVVASGLVESSLVVTTSSVQRPLLTSVSGWNSIWLMCGLSCFRWMGGNKCAVWLYFLIAAVD